MSNLEQILEATPCKTTAMRAFTPNLKNYPSKTRNTYGTLLEKQGRTNKGRYSMNPNT